MEFPKRNNLVLWLFCYLNLKFRNSPLSNFTDPFQLGKNNLFQIRKLFAKEKLLVINEEEKDKEKFVLIKYLHDIPMQFLHENLINPFPKKIFQ